MQNPSNLVVLSDIHTNDTEVLAVEHQRIWQVMALCIYYDNCFVDESKVRFHVATMVKSLLGAFFAQKGQFNKNVYNVCPV